jgi:NTP pyrophosphatase (non-canonical NTP hydrolase)
MGKVKQPKPPRQRKMEKNFIAINQKGYSRYPYKTNTLQFLLNRAQQELDELKEAIQQGDTENAQNECADVSNIIDYIFEALQNPQIKQCDVKDCQHCQNGKCTFQAVRIDSVSMCAYVNRYPPQQTAKKPSITERIKCQ